MMQPPASDGSATSSTGVGSVHSHGVAAANTNSTVRMSAPVEHSPALQPSPARAITRGPSSSAARRKVRRCRAANSSAVIASLGQQL
ncbi:hypothetical protein [Nonomuraea turcica]|uniref:hypothetical protein n=1 Tax=Nonomuraea sp. G32 TaxID=3067274 RepID=UPI00273BF917|nr:hypothetical protein [Nonomuraea sp. G32]MDP4512057.1 hypothetical protein [Nonomuraea sp. G32]